MCYWLVTISLNPYSRIEGKNLIVVKFLGGGGAIRLNQQLSYKFHCVYTGIW